MSYLIQPLNEGQELNYVETFEGGFNEAVERAMKMKRALKRALIQGIIGVVITDETGRIVFTRRN